jgi:hypothetical protein
MQKEFNYTFPETSLKIQEIGIRWKPQMWWKILGQPFKSQKAILVSVCDPYRRMIPAYSTSEIGMMIPFGFFNEMKILRYLQGFYKFQMAEGNLSKPYNTEVECRAHYLLWLFESGKAKLQDVKKPEELIQIRKPVNKPPTQ